MTAHITRGDGRLEGPPGCCSTWVPLLTTLTYPNNHADLDPTAANPSQPTPLPPAHRLVWPHSQTPHQGCAGGAALCHAPRLHVIHSAAAREGTACLGTSHELTRLHTAKQPITRAAGLLVIQCLTHAGIRASTMHVSSITQLRRPLQAFPQASALPPAAKAARHSPSLLKMYRLRCDWQLRGEGRRSTLWLAAKSTQVRFST